MKKTYQKGKRKKYTENEKKNTKEEKKTRNIKK